MPAPRSAAWRCSLPPGASRQGLRALADRFEFVHIVWLPSGVVRVFVYDPVKPARSTLDDALPAGVWRGVCGPGVAHSMWDLGGRHAVHGREPLPGARRDLDVSGCLLDSRLLLSGDAGAVRLARGGVGLVELWAGRGRVSHAVAERGHRAVRVGYAWGQDFFRAADRDAVSRLVDRCRPAVILCAPQCRDFCSWQNVNAAKVRGFATGLRRRRLAQVVILRWMCRVLLAQLLRGGDIIVEQPRRSKMWSVFCIRRLVRLASQAGAPLDFVDLDQCRFGLVDPVSGRAFQKSTRFLVSRKHRYPRIDSSSLALSVKLRLSTRGYSRLALKCACRKDHEPLSGITTVYGRSCRKTRFAEDYPRRLAVALADVVTS